MVTVFKKRLIGKVIGCFSATVQYLKRVLLESASFIEKMLHHKKQSKRTGTFKLALFGDCGNEPNSGRTFSLNKPHSLAAY